MPDLDTAAGEAEGGQLELLGVPALARDREAEIVRRRAGRPPGSGNRRLEEIARLIALKFGDARLHQARVATMQVDELCERYRCTAVEAETLRRLAFVAVAPYLFPRVPIAVDVTNHQVVSLTIHKQPAPAAGQAGSGRKQLTY